MRELNLIPYELRKAKTKQYQTKKIVMIASGVLSVLAIGIAIPSVILFFLNKQETQIKADVEKSKYVLEERDKIKAETNNINQYLTQVQLVSSGRISLIATVKSVQKYIPIDTHLEGLNYDSKKISLKGATGNYNSICEFAAMMDSKKEFKRAAINNITYNDTTKLYNFDVTVDKLEVTNSGKTK